MIELTISAVFMTTQMLASCASKADNAEATDNVEAVSDAEQLNDSTADLQEVAEVEKTYPIGDRALYDVVGNVKSINYESPLKSTIFIFVGFDTGTSEASHVKF